MWLRPPSSPTMVGSAVDTIVESSAESMSPVRRAPSTNRSWRLSIGASLPWRDDRRRRSFGRHLESGSIMVPCAPARHREVAEMGMPSGIGIVDTMIGFPHKDMKAIYSFITRQTNDRQSKDEFEFPVEYMFKQVPEKDLADVDDPVSTTLREMDRWGIEKGLIGVGDPAGEGELALKRYPDRFIPSTGVNPNEGMEGIRKLVRHYETYGVRAVG